MASIAKRASAVHPHCRRLRNAAKHENSPPKAHAEKIVVEASKQNMARPNQKAKVCKKSYEGSAKRTVVSRYLSEVMNWQKQYKEDKFFRYRVISRRYLRKLSLQHDHNKSPTERRKISWGDEIEILFFDSQDTPAVISGGQKIKEAIARVTQ